MAKLINNQSITNMPTEQILDLCYQQQLGGAAAVTSDGKGGCR